MVTADPAGIGIEGDDRRRVEVVARMHVTGPRRRVARPPERQVELRIVVRREPHRDAARLPRFALPALVTRLARSRDRMGLPHRLAVARVKGGDVAADPELAARGADHDLALGDERGQREVVAVLVIVDGGVPHDRARLGVEGDEVRIDRRDVHPVPPERHAPVGRVELQQILGQLLLVAPEEVTGLRPQRDDLLLGRRDEHHAVVDDGRRLMALGDAGGEAPHRHQLLDVRGRDLLERAVSPAAVVAAVHQPVLRLRIEEPLLGHRVVAPDALRCEHRRPEHGERGTDHSQRSQRHRCDLLVWRDRQIVRRRLRLLTPLRTRTLDAR